VRRISQDNHSGSVASGGGISALTSPSIHSEVDASGLSRRAEKAVSRRDDSGLLPDRLGPARGIVLAAFVGLVMWITLIGLGYFLVELARR